MLKRDYQNYLRDSFDSSLTKIKASIEKIDACTCFVCGGGNFFQDGKCIYCGDINDKYLRAVSKVFKEIEKYISFCKKNDISNLFTNDFFDHLYLLKDKGIPQVDQLLAMTNYVQNFDDRMKKIEKLLPTFDIMSYQDYETISFILRYNLCDKSKIFSYCNYVIRNTILQKYDFSRDTFRFAIKRFAEEAMSLYVKNPRCIFKNIPSRKNEKVRGEAGLKNIYIDNEVINGAYNKNKNTTFRAIATIFHETRHVHQFKRWRSKFESIDDIRQIKEKVIELVYEDYYSDNYDLISYEKEAKIRALIDAYNYYNSLGCGFLFNYESLREEIKEELEKHSEQLRIIDGRQASIDVLFEQAINERPELLDSYPQLLYQYKVERSGLVRAKTYDELETDLSTINSNNSLSKEKKEYLNIVYRLLIDEAVENDRYSENER